MLVAVSRYMRLWNVTHILIAPMSASDRMSTFVCCPVQVSVYHDFNNLHFVKSYIYTIIYFVKPFCIYLQIFNLFYARWVLGGTIGMLTCYATYLLYFFSLLCSVLSMTAMNLERYSLYLGSKVLLSLRIRKCTYCRGFLFSCMILS